jgi:hypothetical protein
MDANNATLEELQALTTAELKAFIADLPVVSDDASKQEFYVKCRLGGECHNMASIFALRRPPGTSNTDRAFFQNKHNGEELKSLPVGMAKRAAERYKRETGRDIPQGAVYISQLAKKPGDPAAYFDTVGDIKRACERSGAGCDALGIKPVEVAPPPKKVDYAPRLLNRRLRGELMKPENKEKRTNQRAIREMAEKIKDKHSYKPDA